MALQLSAAARTASAECTVVAATQGTVTYEWQSADTDTPGAYNAEFSATYPGGVEILPSTGYVSILITKSLA